MDKRPSNLAICAFLEEAYGVTAVRLEQLDWGADLDTAVFRLTTQTETFFFKLRRGPFHQPSVTLPNWLVSQGVEGIIPTRSTQSGEPTGKLAGWSTLLYPFVVGKNGYESKLTIPQWQRFGTLIKQLHTADYPSELVQNIPQETFSAEIRLRLAAQMARLDTDTFSDGWAQKTAVFLQEKRSIIQQLLNDANQLAQNLQTAPLPNVVCHADLHAGNLHITASGTLFLVDWDTLIRAPKEHDLMHIGGALLGRFYSFTEEEKLFFAAYGQADVNSEAIIYYRLSRIIADLAIYAEELLKNNKLDSEAKRSFSNLTSDFLPGHTIEAAYRP